MQKEHTPAEIRPNRTVLRFTEEEVIHALTDYALRVFNVVVPKGKRFVWHPNPGSFDDWTLALGVDHPDPPPTRKDVDDGLTE